MYFTKESSDQLKCNICSTVLTADNKNTASKEHIKDSHKDIYELHKDILECSVGYQIEFLQFSMEGNKTQPVILEEICETQSEVIQEQLPKDIEDMQYILLRNVKSEDICRKRSWVWKYFDKLSKTIFRCNLCDVVLSIKGCNSNNMNRHIRSRHPVVYNSEVESKNKNENEKRPDPNSGKPLRSWVWTYFTRDSRTRATCKLCDKTISHGGNATGNLNRHLKIIHDKIDVSRKPRRSWIWAYFTRDSTTRATCTLCDKSISCGGNTTGNLNRHLKLKHKETNDENSKKRSWIWDYCEEVSEKISRCKICGSNVSVIGGNQSNINRHIIKTHSEVYESDILPKLIAEGKLRNPGPSYSRKYRRSWFWSFFTKVAPREALCHLCDSKVKLRVDGKASFRLRKHLSSTHFNTNDRDCWLWVVFGEEGDEYKCKICSYKCTKTDDMENNLQTIRDHLKTDHGLESDAQIFAVHENENDKNETVRKKRSWIWDYFEELPNKLSQCKLCSMSLSIISGSQGNLNRHMRTNHPVVYKTEVHPMLRKGRPRKEEESSGNESEDEKNTEKENEDEIESENETEYEESAESD